MAYAERSATTKKQTGRWIADAEHDIGNGTTKRHHRAYVDKKTAQFVEAVFRATGELPPSETDATPHAYAQIAEDFKTSSEGKAWVAAHDGQTNAQRLEFSIAFLGKHDVTMIRKEKLDAYRDKVLASAGRAGLPPANRTVNYYLDAVAKVMRYALDKDLLPKGMPSMPRLPNKGKKRDALSLAGEQGIMRALVAAGEHDVAFATRILFMTGVRPGEELLTLRPEQIVLAEQRENTGFELTIEQTKTDAARWIPLLPLEAKQLRVFIAEKRMPEATHLYTTFKKAVLASGENKRCSPYWARHTTFTRLLESGANILDADILIGHANKMVSMGYYHPTHAHLFSVAEKVQMLSGEITKTGDILEFNPSEKLAESA